MHLVKHDKRVSAQDSGSGVPVSYRKQIRTRSAHRTRPGLVWQCAPEPDLCQSDPREQVNIQMCSRSLTWKGGQGEIGSGFRVRCCQSCSSLSIVSRKGEDSGSAWFGSARQAAAPPAVRPGSGVPAALASRSRPENSSCVRAPVCQQPLCRHSAGSQARFSVGPVSAGCGCFSSSFSRQKGRGCRKERGKEENARGIMGNVVRRAGEKPVLI